MTAIIMRDKAQELKGMIEHGLHIFGKCMNIAEQMCEGDFNERVGGGYYGDKMEYPPMPPVPPQYHMPEYWYGDRRGVPGTGRYSMFR